MGELRSRKQAALGLLGLWILASASPAPAQRVTSLTNPAIDMRGYLRAAEQAAQHREGRRLTEEEFQQKSREPGAIILDARSREGFALLHVRGAVSLPFPDITIESLRRTIPDRSTTILIYCNNNFSNAPDPFPAKLATASLNLSTYIALWSYGYRNVYELGPLVDLAASRLEFESAAHAPSEVPAGVVSGSGF